ncbi:MAG: type II toxin-antitoxin system ParD family antitoxin [Aeromicrobium sp.]|uniref:type II toxin-antitoxin system ParD family antitoxin n=1 Tax=Aeromicrobium sp. TaxID=1871063 RepID=UPI0039E62CBA
MPTRNVVLSDHQHALVDTLVRSGRYQNASEVLRDGLRLIERRERLEEAKLTALRAAVDHGWEDIARGRFTDVREDELGDFIARLGTRAASLADSDT